MNEFIDQFLLESRELVDQATDDLLALERTPANRERLDSAFRAFHTLKGGAGIVDFNAMQVAMHSAESVLSAAHSGERALTVASVGDCLRCLDQVARWLDIMQRTGELPADADADASKIVASFAGMTSPAGKERRARKRAVGGDWAETMLGRHTSVQAQAKTAVRYTPDANAFFRGEDPIARVAALPGLLTIDLKAAAPWPSLEALDPFKCNLIIEALTQDAPDQVARILADAIDQCDIRLLKTAAEGAMRVSRSNLAREIVEAQMLLAGVKESSAHGAIASAAIVVGNVLRRSGKSADAEEIDRAIAKADAAKDWTALGQAIVSAAASMNADVAPPGMTGLSGRSAEPAQVRTLRVDVARIEALVKLTGELTVAKNAIGHATKLAEQGSSDAAAMLKRRHAVLDRLVSDLQQSVLAMHMLPMRAVFQRLPRLLREIAGTLGKPATLMIEGEDTEADKAIVEMLFEPLLHLVRNAIDHGVEDAATRAAAGKPPAATILLRAARERDRVILEVRDDGAGVDVARVRQVALERGVASAADLSAMADDQAIDLIFAAGFSTAARVTGLSGRGVGMDAVRNAVQRIGGHVEVRSEPGRGTVVRLSLPFSIMMTRVMTVVAGGQAFGIPLDHVVESVRVRADEIIPVGAAKAVVLRNQTVPVVELAESLGLRPSVDNGADATIVVARVDDQLAAVRVDKLGERLEVMLKPLEGFLSGMPGIAGSTMLGDGNVLLVLNLGELVL